MSARDVPDSALTGLVQDGVLSVSGVASRVNSREPLGQIMNIVYPGTKDGQKKRASHYISASGLGPSTREVLIYCVLR